MSKNKDDQRHDDAETKIINPEETDTFKMDVEKAKAANALLVVIRGTPQGKRFNLIGKELIIGRDRDCHIQLSDANISRRHAVIRKKEDGFYVADYGSRNGTFLNDNKLEKDELLSKEDMIRIGTTVLKYIPQGHLEILYHGNLTNAAYIDKLTQVYNRNYISEVLDAEFKRARALHTDFPIIIFDIDDFKKINDTYGHDAGDYVLRDLCGTIKKQGLRERDLLGRYGGEEFLLLLTNANIQKAKELAERIRSSIEKHKFIYEDKEINVTISLGIANVVDEHNDSTDLYKMADKALYESKRTGKNKVTVAD